MKGFTILEALLSMTVMLLVVTSLTVYIFQLVRTNEKFSMYSENYRNSAAAFEIITGEIRSANHIDPLSSPSRLVLDNASYVIAFDLPGGKVRKTKNSSVSYLTPDNTVDDMVFSFPAVDSVIITMKPAGYPCFITTEASCRN